MYDKQNQRGAALVIVLFVVALAATLAVEMSSRLMIQVQKNSNLQDYQQAKWYGYAAEAFAKKVILEAKKQDKDKTHLQQAWAADETTFPVDGGTITGKITDLQACLNLNSLRASQNSDGDNSVRKDNDGHKALLALIKNIDELPIEESEESLADSVLDWVDADSNNFGEGAEEDEYLSRKIPYLTANHYLASLSELRLIKGFNPLVMKKITPLVCVIPGNELLAININTLKTEQSVILSALIKDLDKEAASAIISARPEDGWSSINDFIAEAVKNGAKNLKNDDPRFVLKSDYFQLASTTTYADSRFQITTVFHVEDNKKITILARKFGAVQ
ncbi:type II secretion system minor pseudopilin GspK [Pseudoalteromonas tunicata]|jgi:general secretion pathway protein K|uniref:Type II secretion system protein K n=1 Tax=Pseudoalteromonas tunicata D2 TaxID=87626 RepID=A4CET0_9GAMM|nr:type II secretion system minor pseudopilin GspK [Pseudoalteromonas tunicata]ATC96070.1 general secretion pathway protein K [Pseudoalteromonas tunicata]AXT31599.1 general secretion pathway protein GspK [Pseudoalteromonas tunicata]EAR26809.1 putative general secretion pathway protein [Pseudoalteromonas tunicata D2]MDP4982647.1 type II secretion system minor pseudopilin GspK [Pseudoalteromonas tunicata]MDP5213270.1 type II secretion system minor pseudopilin GspK [Pseudoalteromonas tunicata]